MGHLMAVVPLEADEVPMYTRILADADLDGLMGAALLKAFRPEATVKFSHAAAVRGGFESAYINASTVMVDLPFDPACGWYIDHHATNRPTKEEETAFVQAGGAVDWAPAPSAARVVHDLLQNVTPVDHLTDLMPWVDALDSGGISLDDFRADGPALQFSRCCSLRHEATMHRIVNMFAQGADFDAVMADPEVASLVAVKVDERRVAEAAVAAHTTLHDRLAVCRLEDTDLRINGYIVTAWAGERADACCVVHGYTDGDASNRERPPLGASFYANSFLPGAQGTYDLSRMATSLDPTGGGHRNACGCRVQPPGLDDNLQHWLGMWYDRDRLLR